MNVLSLFDGMSCGQIALKELGIIPDIYYASEIDKHAIAQTQLNFPNTIQLGSVVNVDVSKLKHIDLLIGGSPCFIKGTNVICRDEIKSIEDVVIGDYVLTHNNRFNKVLATGYCFNNTIKVNCQGIMPITTTHEHPFYVREMNYKYDNKRRTSYRHFEEPKWKMASDLKKGDFLGFPILNTNENPLQITEDEAYIIGRYIADGHTRKDYRLSENRPNDRHWQLILSIGYKKLDEFNKTIKLKHSCYKHTKSVYRCVFSSKRLVEIVEEHCGIGSNNKHFSMMLLNLPVNILKRVLDGYLSGDGCLIKDVYKTSSISNDISISLALAIAKVYRVGFTYGFVKKEPTCVIEGRVVNQSDCHTMRFKTESPIQANYKVIGDSVWLPVRDVIETECKEQVFNLEVENDNSYTANGVYVHNCQSFSFAGKRKGMSTKCEIEITKLEQYLELKEQGFEFEGQSYLFWEYMRILTDIRKYNPNVKFLLENVEMGAKWERILSEAIGVYGVHINSALVSAQNRKRIYWFGQNRERFYYSENYCYLCDKKRIEYEKKIRGIQNSTQRERKKQILGNSQRGQSNMCNMQQGVLENRTERNNENMLGNLSKGIKKDNGQKSGQDKKSGISEKILSRTQNGVDRICEELSKDRFRKTNNEESRFRFIADCQKENENSFKEGDRWNYCVEDGRFNLNPKYETYMYCVCCGKELDHRPYRSVISYGDKRDIKSPDTLSKMQFEEARQNNGRIFDIYSIGVKGQESMFGETIADIPQPEDKGIVLKDILESEVDKKYYLSDRLIKTLSNRPKGYQNLKPKELNEKASSIVATMFKMHPSDNYVIQLNPSKERGGEQPYQQNSVYDSRGLSPVLCANKADLLIRTPSKDALLIKEATKKGYTEIKPGECFDYENPKSKTRRGRKMESKSNSLMAQNMSFMKYTENCHIRKLTPLECSRLQTIPSWYVWNCSDTQAYKLLGNGWNIETVKHIFKFMK